MESQKIYIHPIFYELQNNFLFFFVGINMMCIQDFQRALIHVHKGKKSEIEISVQYNNFKCFKYDIRDVFNLFNQEVALQKINDEVKANIKNLIIFQARQCAISLFDILQNSHFNKHINKQEIFKFAKHIRHGAAHNNKFTFDSKTRTELPIVWKNKTIDISLHNNEVFGKFLVPADLILLISDISNIFKGYE